MFADACNAVMLSSTAVASSGIDGHWPLVPRAETVRISRAPSGVVRPPTPYSGRVSISRHEATGVKIARSPPPFAASTRPIPPAPKVIATAAPTAAHRVRISSIVPA
ncbi:MAG: hypothetical protein KDB37_00755 [Ilumatobacter sp.]|nr:hypothetical protein [Ilumatobacter sp.]